MKIMKQLTPLKSVRLIVTLAAFSATVSCTTQGTIGGLEEADLSEINEQKIDKVGGVRCRAGRGTTENFT